MRICLHGAVIGALSLFLVRGVVAQQGGFETPIKLSSVVAAPGLKLSGQKYQVRKTVTADGFYYLFTVKTEWGVYHVRGLSLLRERLQEFGAQVELDKFTDSKVFAEAAKKAGVNLVLAPIDEVRRVVEAVSDPEETWETMKKVPDGIAGLFRSLGDTVSSGVKSVSGAVQSSPDERDPNKRTNFEKTEAFATEVALDYIGWNRNEAEWYRRYGVDPYTTNRPLRDKIARIVGIQQGVGFAAKFVPAFGQIKVVSDISSVLSRAEQLSLYADPKQQNTKDRDLLLKFGASDEQIAAFQDNRYFSPAQRHRVVLALGKFGRATNRQETLRAAADVAAADAARFFTESIEQLAARGGAATQVFLPDVRLPVSMLAAGEYLLVLPLDHVMWTEALEQGFSKLAVKLGGAACQILVLGKVTPRAHAEFRSRGFRVTEDRQAANRAR